MRVVIVGAGQAGAAVAAKLRTLDHKGEIILIGDELAPPYQRPPLSKAYLLGEIGEDRLWLRAPNFWIDNQIDLRLGQPVVGLDAEAKSVTVGEEEIPYDHLVLATGSTPRRLPVQQGGDLEGVYTLRTLSDVDRMRTQFAPGRQVVVIGGGYIGLEAAAVARKLDLEVTLLEGSPRILSRVASIYTSDFIRDLHLQNGVTFLEGISLERIRRENKTIFVQLADGRELLADFVIVGVGVTPCTGLAKLAGLHLDNGIATDQMGRTSDPFIWAVGDCASFPWKGQRIRLESVGNAIDQAETVAANLLGAGQPYITRPWFWSDQYDLKLQIFGLSAGHDHVVLRREGGMSVWYYRENELLAVDALGDARAYMVGKRLIESGKSPNPDDVRSTADIKTLLK